MLCCQFSYYNNHKLVAGGEVFWLRVEHGYRPALVQVMLRRWWFLSGECYVLCLVPCVLFKPDLYSAADGYLHLRRVYPRGKK